MSLELKLNVIGYIAGSLITICLMPQLHKIIKSKNTEGISVMTYVLLLLAECLWVSYGVMKNDLRIVIANVVSGGCSLTIICLYFVYK